MPGAHFVSPKIEVRPSKTGRGVFAKSNISKGEMVFDSAKGPFKCLSKGQLAEFMGKEEYKHYVFQLDDMLFYAPMNGPEERDFMNHSCEPTVGISDCMTFHALRDISIGEEITYDYGTSESTEGWRMQCGCGQAACRKTISGRDWRLPALQKKYGSHFSYYILKKIRRHPLHKTLSDGFSRLRALLRR